MEWKVVHSTEFAEEKKEETIDDKGNIGIFNISKSFIYPNYFAKRINLTCIKTNQ